jgi:O-Antigen ligase/Tetratricopeptide repeat
VVHLLYRELEQPDSAPDGWLSDTRRRIQANGASGRLSLKHAVVVAVAVLYIAVSVAEGGYTPEFIAAGTLLIWWAVIVGLAVGAWPRAQVPRPAIAAGVCIFCLALLTALSLGWASDDGRAFVEILRVASYAGLFVLVLLASSEGSARSWLVGLAIGLVGVACLALGSRFVDALPGQDREIGAFITSARNRLSYPIGYWNALGACMAMATVLVVWLGARAESRLGRAAAIAAMPPVLLAIDLTASRGAVLAMVLGLGVLLALGPARMRLAAGLVIGVAGGIGLVGLTELRPVLIDDPGSAAAYDAGEEILLATLIVAAATGLVRYLADDAVRRLTVPGAVTRVALVLLVPLAIAGLAAADPPARFEEFKQAPGQRELGDLASGTGSGRYQYWSAALDAFASDPVTGIGAGGYEAWWNQNGSITRVLRNAHSLFFETLGELGLAGLLLVLAFLALGAVYGWRRRAGGSPDGAVEVALALLAAGVFTAAIEWTWELPAAFGPVVIAVALLVGPATIRRSPGPVGEPGSDGPRAATASQRSFSWGVATLLVGWVAVWLAGLVLLTEVKLDDSRAAFDRGDLSAAAQDATDASTLQPWAAEPWLQLALVEEEAGNLTQARRAIAEAIDRAPDDWSLWYAASQIEYRAAGRTAALEAYERARALNPRSPIFDRRKEPGAGRES